MNDEKRVLKRKRILARLFVLGLAVFGIVTVSYTNPGIIAHSNILRRAAALVTDAFEPTTPPPSLGMNPTSFPLATDPVRTIPNHISIPTPLHAIYISSYSAGSKAAMNRINPIFATSSINAVVIDIKDATGRLSYLPTDPYLVSTGVGTARIPNIKSLIESLHQKGIYVIGRVTVFQDPYYAGLNPEEAFKNSETGEMWKDYKGIAWLRPNSEKVWQYAVTIARDAYAQGFDEINMDYVRFPSDGNLSLLDKTSFTKSRLLTMQDFFMYLDKELRQVDHIPLSADLFGLTMSARDDLGIGQTLAIAAPYVDYIAPMIYPSHFAAGTYGIPLPAAAPGDIISRSLADGSAKLAKLGIPKEKLRPWLQDFSIGGVIYTQEMVRAQIEASEALGVNSWMIWNPGNRYTAGTYNDETPTPTFIPTEM